MPLKLNIGLNKKVGESNYGSRGASVNLEVEVDSSLVTEPGKFQEKVRQLFGLVRTSLNEELNGNGNHGHSGNGNAQEGNDRPNGNGNGAQRETGDRPRAATQSQIKAIYGIAKGQGLNPQQLVRERFQVNRPEDLTIKQASSIIEELKKNGNPKGG